MMFTVNGRFLSRPMTGVDRVAENILLRIDSQWPVELYGRYKVAVPKNTQSTPTLKNGDIVSVGHRTGLAWEQLDLPAACKADVIFNPCNTAPLRHKQNIVIIHDANVVDYPASYSAGFRAWYRILLPRIARKAKAIVTVSEHSADRLVANKITRDRPIVISNGCDHLPSPAAPGPKRQKTVLFVGSPAAHKNLKLFTTLAAQFEAKKIPFHVAGARAESVFAQNDADAPAPSNLKFLGRVTEDELIALYQTAHVLLFPSYVEGFGLTPLEAQSFGCPVISSNRAPMTEILSDTAIYADPDDLEQWTTALNTLLESQDVWETYASKAKQNAAGFTWSEAADQYLAVILRVLKNQSNAAPSHAPAQAVGQRQC